MARVVRRAFSDPRVPHESTGVEGRGTEEVKTNDVTGRVKIGEVGFTIEFGRPGVGVWFREIQLMWALGRSGRDVREEESDHVADDRRATGTLREDILNEKLMSAIVEIKVPVARIEEVIRLVWDIEKRIDTVVALGVGTRCDETARTMSSRPCSRSSATSCSARRPTPVSAASPISRGCKPHWKWRNPMTNTLHRFGDAHSFRDDYIVFAIASRKERRRRGAKLKRSFSSLRAISAP